MRDNQKILVIVALVALLFALKGGFRFMSFSLFGASPMLTVLLLGVGIWYFFIRSQETDVEIVDEDAAAE